ncbi:hypothetical protein AAEO56_12160 [Flavobacterium sp. DGU11]|uniref:Uncharacterized protein n=1 Tax=Flavobacterium arundinis TaxID=3139143 RepID=A0ABU9HYM2_9FLAO
MKKIMLLLITLLLYSCVQETRQQVVTFTIDTKGIPPGSSVAVRGGDKPLSWEQDYPLVYDSVSGTYKATVQIATGYLFTEYKYVVNGTFELANEENRRAIFSADGNTVLNDKYNVR